jgi:hypothetical protein
MITVRNEILTSHHDLLLVSWYLRDGILTSHDLKSGPGTVLEVKYLCYITARGEGGVRNLCYQVPDASQGLEHCNTAFSSAILVSLIVCGCFFSNLIYEDDSWLRISSQMAI